LADVRHTNHDFGGFVCWLLFLSFERLLQSGSMNCIPTMVEMRFQKIVDILLKTAQ
jgi:hypothetical protein